MDTRVLHSQVTPIMNTEVKFWHIHPLLPAVQIKWVDPLKRRIIQVIGKYLDGMGVRRINRTICGEYKSSNGYIFNEKLLLKYYFDSEGYWKSFTASNTINGRLPGGETFKGNAVYSNNQIFFGESVFPLKTTKIGFYKYGDLKAASTFTTQTTYTRKSGRNVIQNTTFKTTTYFANGGYRNSIIKTYYNFDGNGHLMGTKIAGTATGYDMVNNKKAYYSSTITMPTRTEDDTIYYYKEIKDLIIKNTEPEDTL